MALLAAGRKWVGARVRALGAAPAHPRWAERAQVCAACPLRMVRGGVVYCGRPAWERPWRDPAEGCGCPATAKARDPAEHCPLDARHRPRNPADADGASGDSCDCKWCLALRSADR